MATWYELGLQPADESWRAIRRARADIGPSIRSKRRREVFHTALEQAQQQFRAAAAIRYDSRALNLFYGLSQAGRAFAAISRELDEGSRDANRGWEASGHGLQYRSSPRKWEDFIISEIAIQPARADLFSRVGFAAGMPSMEGRVPIRSILNQIPDFRMRFEQPGSLIDLHPGANHDLYRTPSPTANLGIELPGIHEGSALSQIREAMDCYPGLSDFDIVIDDTLGVPRVSRSGQVELSAAVSSFTQLNGYYYPRGATRYRGNAVLLPKLAGLDQAIHPLLSWWLVLFALSMLCRYKPSEWAALLSIQTGEASVRIEWLLDSALDAVPELLSEVIRAEADREGERAAPAE